MDVDVESKINLSHREIRVLLLHEFRLGQTATEAASKHMRYDGSGSSLHSYRATLVQSFQEWGFRTRRLTSIR